jgi:glycerol uptake facilitator
MDAYLGELLGTLLLVLLGDGVVANVLLAGTKGHDSGWIVISFGWGMAVFVAVWCVGPISGAHINPAVTLGLAAAGEFAWSKVAGYVAAQMIGAIAGAVVVYLVYRDHYAVTADPDAKLATFCTGPAIRRASTNLLSEVMGTLVLVLAVLLAIEPSLIADGPLVPGVDMHSTKIGLGALGALPVGLLVFSIGLSLGGTTGYAINPARDLGPRIAHALLPIPGKRDSDWPYAWIPILGPLAGALLAAALFALLR